MRHRGQSDHAWMRKHCSRVVRLADLLSTSAFLFDIRSVRFFKYTFRCFFSPGRPYASQALQGGGPLKLSCDQQALTIWSLQHLRSGQKRLRPKWHIHSSLLHPSVGNLGVPKEISHWDLSKRTWVKAGNLQKQSQLLQRPKEHVSLSFIASGCLPNPSAN